MEEEGTELSLGADALRDARGELRRVIVGDTHAAGSLAGKECVSRLARHLAEHDRHAAILRSEDAPDELPRTRRPLGVKGGVLTSAVNTVAADECAVACAKAELAPAIREERAYWPMRCELEGPERADALDSGRRKFGGVWALHQALWPIFARHDPCR